MAPGLHPLQSPSSPFGELSEVSKEICVFCASSQNCLVSEVLAVERRQGVCFSLYKWSNIGPFNADQTTGIFEQLRQTRAVFS